MSPFDVVEAWLDVAPYSDRQLFTASHTARRAKRKRNRLAAFFGRLKGKQ